MPSRFITIDGDDIGQLIVSCYLNNDSQALTRTNEIISAVTKSIAQFLQLSGFTVLFCAADGVAAYSESETPDDQDLFLQISSLAGDRISFSIGVGATLREAYIALLSAKSSGKARIHNYRDLSGNA